MRIILLACAVAAIVATGCADDDDSEDAGATPPSGQAAEPPAETGTAPEPSAEPEPGDAAHLIDGEARGLYLYEPGGPAEPLTGADALGERGVGLDWFSDGQSLAAFGTNLLRVSLNGDAETLYEPEDLVFLTAVSPDGQRVAFSCSGPQSADVCIVAAEPAGQLTRASEDEYFDYLVDWLDDERILILSDSRPGAPDIPVYEGHFPRQAGYFVLNTVDGNVVPATDSDVRDPWLSPNGEWTFDVGAAPTYAFFTNGETDETINVPVNAEDIERIDPTALPEQFDVAWSADGAYASLVQRVVVEEEGFIRSAYNVWLIDLAARSVELAVQMEPCQTDLDCNVTAEWSPDSGQLAILFGIAGD